MQMKCLVFAPGILGTGLRNSKGKVWPPNASEIIFGYHRIDDLLSPDLFITNIIEEIWPVNVYQSLLDDVKACGYSEEDEEKCFIPFPYDWRKSNTVSANSLSNILDSHFPDEEDDLQITLMGHSMGGLVMRYLLESGEFIHHPWFNSIDRLITMGTPHYGAPLALFKLSGNDKYAGLSGRDVKKMANDSRYPSSYELVPPTNTALTVSQPMPGSLPHAKNSFDDDFVTKFKMNPDNIVAAQSFWEKMDISKRPGNVDYLFIVGSAMKTNVRIEWINETTDPLPIYRKASGDGTVPLASAHISGVPHIFSQKKHSSIFTDRDVRKHLYHFLDAPIGVTPQSADEVEVGDEDAIGLSVDQEVYDPGEEIEVVITFNKAVTLSNESFDIVPIDIDSNNVDTDRDSLPINVNFRGAKVKEFSFSIVEEITPGLYELRSYKEIDDPEGTRFYIRGM